MWLLDRGGRHTGGRGSSILKDLAVKMNKKIKNKHHLMQPLFLVEITDHYHSSGENK